MKGFFTKKRSVNFLATSQPPVTPVQVLAPAGQQFAKVVPRNEMPQQFLAILFSTCTHCQTRFDVSKFEPGTYDCTHNICPGRFQVTEDQVRFAPAIKAQARLKRDREHEPHMRQKPFINHDAPTRQAFPATGAPEPVPQPGGRPRMSSEKPIGRVFPASNDGRRGFFKFCIGKDSEKAAAPFPPHILVAENTPSVPRDHRTRPTEYRDYPAGSARQRVADLRGRAVAGDARGMPVVQPLSIPTKDKCGPSERDKHATPRDRHDAASGTAKGRESRPHGRPRGYSDLPEYGTRIRPPRDQPKHGVFGGEPFTFGGPSPEELSKRERKHRDHKRYAGHDRF
ncbi:hypothetical protein FISHEDRAFT_55807 [Fistulina hepatica ATCC 64428]|uniref:Uncharacterized protein n=1 Tax=Fistulina hepatica ATCC 64428 TaxID=1128425 RepID=A0A0D7ALY7_9AGAR|nr:hypothetical protein FISHEDRAFT_55807 [Fistulina hepatica ATCC 64428]